MEPTKLTKVNKLAMRDLLTWIIDNEIDVYKDGDRVYFLDPKTDQKMQIVWDRPSQPSNGPSGI